MLIGVAGRGWYQEEGKPAQEILPGTVIHIPAGVKHWHGADADSWFAHLAFEISGEQVPIANVTFEPGCRNNWHIHHATKGGGQMLIGVAGRGWYQEWGKPAQEILPGTVIHIPAGVKHWHGAAADSWFAHLAFEIEGENASNEWLEPVSDEAYEKVNAK